MDGQGQATYSLGVLSSAQHSVGTSTAPSICHAVAHAPTARSLQRQSATAGAKGLKYWNQGPERP